jgi:hypothetical protein
MQRERMRRLYEVERGERGVGVGKRERSCTVRVCTLTIILVPCRLELISA